ncbi:hypothetical protein Hanom_Chr03g00185061 [Helianthus anomalus]
MVEGSSIDHKAFEGSAFTSKDDLSIIHRRFIFRAPRRINNILRCAILRHRQFNQ